MRVCRPRTPDAGVGPSSPGCSSDRLAAPRSSRSFKPRRPEPRHRGATDTRRNHDRGEERPALAHPVPAGRGRDDRVAAAIGFTEHATYRDEADSSVVHHAEWLWPDGGGIMFGTRRDDSPINGTGPAAAYLVTGDPDAVFDRAVAAGASRRPGDGRPGLRRPRRHCPRPGGEHAGPSGTTSPPDQLWWESLRGTTIVVVSRLGPRS